MNNQYANLHKVLVFGLCKTQIYIFWSEKLLTLVMGFDTIIVLGRFLAPPFLLVEVIFNVLPIGRCRWRNG